MTQGAVDEVHPALQKLVERCEELGLTDIQTGLLRDLCGWNSGAKVPESMRGVEPLASLDRLMDTSRTFVTNLVAREITGLVLRLLGESSGEDLTVANLRKKYQLSEQQAVWVLMQLRHSRVEQYVRVVALLSYLDPRELCNVVAPAIGGLVENAD